MTLNYFDPSKSNEMAKFQGSFVGIQAGNAHYGGVGMAPTSVFNQAGFYALESSDSPYIQVKKLAPDSVYTKQWYDQGTGQIFNFSGTSSSSSADEDSSTDNSSSDAASNSNSDSSTAAKTNSSYSSSDLDYYEAALNADDTSTVSSSSSENDVKTVSSSQSVTADQLQDLVDQGVYSSLDEALNTTLNNGYTVSDDEQAKLGLYSASDENKIRSMMSTYGISREDAIASLGNKIEDPTTNALAENLEEQLGDVQDKQGFLGKAWNAVKSFFNAGTSSNDAEYAIEMFKNGELSYDEAQKIIEQYQSKQDQASNGIKSAVAIGIGAVVGLCTGGVGGFIAAGLLGAGAKAGLGILDRSTNEVENDEVTTDVLTDAGTGAVDGVIGWTGGKVLKTGGKVVHAAKKAVTH